MSVIRSIGRPNDHARQERTDVGLARPGTWRKTLSGMLAGAAALGLVSGSLSIVSTFANAVTPTLPLNPPLAFEDSNGGMTCDQGAAACTGATPQYLDWGSSYVASNGLVSQPAVQGACAPVNYLFTQGTHENTIATNISCGTGPPNKEDLTQEYAWDQTVGTDTYLYLAWEVAAVSGQADNHIDFELNQAAQNPLPTPPGTWNLIRTSGDLLINFDITKGKTSLSAFSWNGSSWAADAVPPGDEQSSVSTGAGFTDPYTGVSQPAGTFGEMGIDLTAAGLFTPGVCTNFADVWAKTRSSGSGGTAELKDFIPPTSISVDNCKSTTTTTPSQASISVGSSLTDSATVTGTGSTTVPTGTVDFYWCGPTATSCSSSGTLFDTENLSGGKVAGTSVQVTSIPFFPSQAGDFCFAGVYSGGSGYPSSSDGSSDECFRVDAISTNLSKSSIAAGGSVTDTATLSGTSSPLGTDTITYAVYTDSKCTTQATTGAGNDISAQPGSVLVSAGSPYTSPSVTFNNVGTYYWQAEFSGDANNAAATSPCTSETLAVGQNPTSITTGLSSSAVTVGGSANDTATLTGAVAPLGTDTITYTVYTEATCKIQATVGAGNDISAQPGSVLISAGSPYTSPSVTFNLPGTYYWQAMFSGDANNSSSTSGCTTETLNVDAISTALSSGIATVGGAVHDTAALTDVVSPLGADTITYTVYTDSTCKTQATTGAGNDISAQPGSVLISAGSPYTSASVTFNVPGTYYWQAVFSGDANNAQATSPCTSETLFVDAIATGLSSSAVTVGGAVSDTATLTDVVAPLGTDTITYTVYTDSACTTQATTGAGNQISAQPGSVLISAGSPYTSASVTFNQAGTYYWQAVFSGDSNNALAVSPCTSETLFVDAISTALSAGTITAGGSVHDTSTLTGTSSPLGTDTITYTVYTNSTCTTAATTGAGNDINAQPGAVLLSAGSPYTSASVTFNKAGTYYWQAVFSGDRNNAAATSPCGSEVLDVTAVVVSPPPPPVLASPTITTSASPSSGTAGVAMTNVGDTATFHNTSAGGATGSVTFTLFSDSGCSVTVAGMSGSGTISTSGGVSTASWSAANWTPPAAGVYYWKASYLGDANNHAFTTSCGDAGEEITVVPPTAAASPFLLGSKNSIPAPGSTVVRGQTVIYSLTLTNLGSAVASAITETDTVPTGTTYVSGSASCGGVPTCSVTVANGVITWTGINVAALTGGTAGMVTLSFDVTVNSDDTNGQVIRNLALFSNENTPSCTDPVCPTNAVTLTVQVPTPPPVTTSASSPPPIAAATTVHTGEPWAGSRLPEEILGLFGLGLFGFGLRRRRQYRVRARGSAA